MSKELIRLSDCVVKFDDEIVLDHLNLYINDKEFLTLLGPSGCGNAMVRLRKFCLQLALKNPQMVAEDPVLIMHRVL